MKQFQIMYEKERGFLAWLARIRDYCERNSIKESSAIFRIFTDSIDQERIVPILRKIREEFPGSLYAGSTSAGNIIRGGLAGTHVSLTCTIFNCPYSKAEVLQFPMVAETQERVAETVIEAVRLRPWVRAVEMMTTLRTLDLEALCLSLAGLPEDVAFYGGAAMASDIKDNDTSPAFVFSSAGEPAPFSAVFLLIGGPHLFVRTWHLIGWKRLGFPLTATSFKGNQLFSLNSRPAVDVYQEMLHPPLDGRFVKLANVFPLYFDLDRTGYLRVVASSCPEDGSLRMSAPIRIPERASSGGDDAAVQHMNTEGTPFSPVSCSIAFGDPVDILKSLEEKVREVSDFSPQVIQLFSCLARKYFWGASEVSRETFPFEMVAPASGYYTAGEFLRTEKEILLHNITIVIACMREGEPPEEKKDFSVATDDLSTQLLIGSCLSSFIDYQSREMEKQNSSSAE